MNQPLLVALITIILFLMWVSIDLWEIHKDISELMRLLSSTPVAKKSKSGENIRDSQNNVKEYPKWKWVNKWKKGSDYDSAKD
jgi:hypothetical protein